MMYSRVWVGGGGGKRWRYLYICCHCGGFHSSLGTPELACAAKSHTAACRSCAAGVCGGICGCVEVYT